MESHIEQSNVLPPDHEGVGTILKAAREAAGLSLGEVADRLKLSLKQLEAIEGDRFEALPGPAFVRGFVRNYARFLGLDAVPLMARLEARFPSAVKEMANQAKETAAPVLARGTDAEAPALLGKRAILLVLAVLLAVAAFWFARPGTEQARDEAKQDLAPMLTEQSAASAPVDAAPVKEAPAPATTPATAPAAPASAPAAAPLSSDDGKIKLAAKQDAWVSVVDGSGKKLVFETLKAGAAKEVAGQPPFKLTVGNASQVEVSFNGQPVEMTGKMRGTTARLELK